MISDHGFTLLELIVVIIIIGILAALGYTQYTLVLEKGRSAEARALLGTLRTAEQAYNLDYGTYTTNINVLSVNMPQACDTSHYFRYWVSTGRCGGIENIGLYATRCSSGGKTPNYGDGTASVVVCTASGVWASDYPY